MNEFFSTDLVAFQTPIWWLVFFTKSSAILLLAFAVDRLFRSRLSASARCSLLFGGMFALVCLLSGAVLGETSSLAVRLPIAAAEVPNREVSPILPEPSSTVGLESNWASASRAEEPAPNVAASGPINNLPTRTELDETSQEIVTAIPLFQLWLAVFFLLLTFSGIACGITARRFMKASIPAEKALGHELKLLRKEIGLSRNVRLRISKEKTSPVLLGLFRPTVILPQDYSSITRAQRRMFLLHELHHVARRDLAVRFFTRIVVSLFWFNPLVWIADRRLIQLQELACDEAVPVSENEAENYADLLLMIAKKSRGLQQNGVIFMASQSRLGERIHSILRRNNLALKLHPFTRGALVGLWLLSIVAGLAQVTRVAAERNETGEAPSLTQFTEEERRHLKGIDEMFRRNREFPAGLHYSGVVECSGWRDSSSHFERFPVPKQFSVWLDGTWEAPIYRADLQPNVSMWENGAAPWSITDETFFSNGIAYKSIQHRDVGKRTPSEWRTGIENLPGIFSVIATARLVSREATVEEGYSSSVPKALERIFLLGEHNPASVRISVTSEEVVFPGEKIVTLVYETVGRKELWFFDPKRDYALRGWIREDLKGGIVHYRRTLHIPELVALADQRWFPKQAHASLSFFDGNGEMEKEYWIHDYQFETVQWLPPKNSRFFTIEGIEDSLQSRKAYGQRAAEVVGGIVVDESGNPISGARVNLLVALDESKRKSLAATTNEEGKWSTPLPESHLDDFSLRISHPDYAEDRYALDFRERTSQPYSALYDQSAKAILKEGIRISGKVIDFRGSPVANAEIVMVRDRWGANIPDVRTDAQGNFTMPRVDPTVLFGSKVYVTAQAKGHGPALRVLSPQSLKEGAPLVIALLPPKKLSLRLIDPSGQPVVGALFAADSWREGTRTLVFEQRTDSEGLVHWNNAPNDAISFDILGADVTLRDCWVEPSDGIVDVVLRPAFTIHGTVVDEVTGAPIESFRVVRGRKTGQSDQVPYWEETQVSSHTRGSFHHSGEHLGFLYSFRIEAHGYETFTTEEFEAKRNDEKIQISLKRL